MLLVSIVMLMSVVVPHHHHSNGLPCYKSLSAEAAHGGHGSSESHDCGCNGHNIALYTSIFSHVTDGNVNQFLFPLLVLFDYINPPVPVFTSSCSRMTGPATSSPCMIRGLFLRQGLRLRMNLIYNL